jgi:putative membrane protein
MKTIPLARARLLAIALACAAGVHCTDATDDGGEPDGAPQLTQPTPDIALTDAQIAGILVAANAAEIQEGNLAATGATRTDVRTFADHVAKAHGTEDDRQKKLFQQLALTPVSTPSSDELASDAAQTMATLSAAKGSAFDAAFVHAQVTANTKYIVLLADSMIPSTKNEALLAELEQTRISVGDQLNDAERLDALLHPFDAGADATVDASTPSDGAIDAADASTPSDGAIDAADAGG